jgi:hypothetical protein
MVVLVTADCDLIKVADGLRTTSQHSSPYSWNFTDFFCSGIYKHIFEIYKTTVLNKMADITS